MTPQALLPFGEVGRGSKRHLHLRLDPVVILRADVLTTETTGVLQLYAALLVEPILETNGEVCLIPAIHLRVTVEGLARSYDVEGIDHGNAVVT